MGTNLLPVFSGCPEFEILAILYLNQDGLNFISRRYHLSNDAGGEENK